MIINKHQGFNLVGDKTKVLNEDRKVLIPLSWYLFKTIQSIIKFANINLGWIKLGVELWILLDQNGYGKVYVLHQVDNVSQHLAKERVGTVWIMASLTTRLKVSS